MRCYEIRTASGVDSLALVERLMPSVGPHQILVKVRAAALNYRDLMVIGGSYARGVKLPLVPLSDGAGEVVEVGAGVERVRVGDRVAGIFFQRWLAGRVTADVQAHALGGSADGMLAEYVVLDADGVAIIPDHLSFVEAATLPCAAVTAWNALVEAGGLTAGDSVLLLGTGGVSVFALQFARLCGARAIVTSSSDEKLSRARALGAAETVNYARTPEWQDVVREMTDGRGVDHVLEIGGRDTVARSLAALAVGGHLAIIGARGGQGGELDRARIQYRALRVSGINVGSRAMFEAMNRAIAVNGMRPVIHCSYRFEDAVSAYRDFAAARHFGKIVIAIEA